MRIKNIIPGTLRLNSPISQSARWYIEYYVYDHQSGKRKRVRKTFNLNKIKDMEKRAQEARRILNILRKINDNTEILGEKRDYSIPEGIEFALKVIDSRTDRGKSVRTYEGISNIFLRWIESKRMQNLSIEMVDRNMAISFLDYAVMERKVSARTHNNYMTIMRTIFNILVTREVVKDNPFSKIKEMKTTQSIRRPMSAYEKSLIMQEVRRRGDRVLEMAIGFVYFTLIRPTELRRLRFGDVDLAGNILTLSGDQTKNRKSAVLTIPDAFVEILVRLNFADYPKEYLIFGRHNEPNQYFPIGEHTLNRRHKEILKYLAKKYNLKIQGLSLYSWKDTGATDMLEGGLTIEELRQQIRHESLDQTQKYLKQFPGVNEKIKNLQLSI